MAAGMHERLSVSGLCFPGSSAIEVLEAVAEIGAAHTTLQVGAVAESGLPAVRACGGARGVAVEALIAGSGPAYGGRTDRQRAQRQLMAAVDIARDLGATTVYMLTGPRGRDSWDLALERFAAFMAPCLAHAAAAGITFAVEPANVLYADLTFVHSAAAAFALARAVDGMKVCLDLFHTWTEPDLRDQMAAGAPLISLVQAGDYVVGDRSLPARAVPGDGGIPLGEIVGWAQESGYRGVFDLELNGPRVEAEGYLAAARRGAQVLSGILGQRS